MIEAAIFGAGRIGHIHAVNIAALQHVKLRYVCDPDSDHAAVLAQRTGAVPATADAILGDGAIGAIVIASPTPTHVELIRRGVAAGKAVFCEKPVDLSVANARDCQRFVAEHGGRCMIGFQRRFDPLYHDAWQRLRAGAIGTPEMLLITSRDPGLPPIDYLRRSGGVFRDMLIHDFDLFRWLLCADGDEAQTVVATGSALVEPALQQIGDVDSVIVGLRTRTGRLCQINASRRARYGYDQRFEILGTGGLLQAGQLPPGLLLEAPGHPADGRGEVFFVQRYAAAYQAEIAHFFDCIANDQPFAVTLEDGLQAQALADAATQSHASGGIPVELARTAAALIGSA